MEFAKTTELDRHYLVCELKEETMDGDYVLEMLVHNVIPGILPVSCQRIDRCQRLSIEIEQMKCLSEAMSEGEMTTREELVCLLKAILQAADQLHDYLLSGDLLVLDPEYIFFSTLERQWYFVCYPGEKTEFGGQIVSLMEYFMQQMNYKNQELVSLVYDCYQMGKRSESGITDYRNYVEALEEKDTSVSNNSTQDSKADSPDGILPLTPEMEQSFPFETVREETHSEKEVRFHSGKTWGLCLAGTVLSVLLLVGMYAGGFFENEVTGMLEPVRLAAAIGIMAVLNVWWYRRRLRKKEYKIITEVTYHNPKENLEPVKKEAEKELDREAKEAERELERAAEKEVGKEETVVLAHQEMDEKTVLLSAVKVPETKPLDYLKACSGEYEDICLAEYPFFIGKLKKNVNYTIEREVISRYHVKLEKGEQEGELIVTDLNSTNGTYLNGRRLSNQERGVLKEGDQLTLADVSYRFEREKP